MYIQTSEKKLSKQEQSIANISAALISRHYGYAGFIVVKLNYSFSGIRYGKSVNERVRKRNSEW